MNSIELQLQALVRQNMAALTLGILILAAGFATLILMRLRSGSGERILLWFGLFASVYGIRLLARNPLIELMFGAQHNSWDVVIAYLDFVIIVPLMLFVQEVYGEGWHSSMRWAVWLNGSYCLLGIGLGLATGVPHFLPDPALLLTLPLLLVVVAAGQLRGYRAPSFADTPVLGAGIAVFLLFVVNEHYGLQGYRAEPVGFFVLICCLGAIAVRQVLRNEQKLLAVEQEMKAARRIQSAILPDRSPELAGLKIAAKYSPMASVAGDFYDFFPVDSKRIGILIADVAGHGVPAALVASMVKVASAAQEARASDPAQVIAGLNQVFCRQRTGHLITAGYLFIDRERFSAFYAGAGHPPLILFRGSDGTVCRYENNGLVLGFRLSETYQNVPISLIAGDRLLLYTDGLIEAENPAGETFDQQLDARIVAHAGMPAREFADALLTDLSAWSVPKGRYTQEDDLTLVVIDIQ